MATIAQLRLRKTAYGQGGYFSTRQAEEAGIARQNHAAYIRSGEWEKPMRGIYRFCDVPRGRYEDMYQYALWLRGADGELQGVFGLESSLAVHELSDFMPSHLHVVTRVGFRRGRLPDAVEFYRLGYGEDSWEFVDGLPVQRPLYAIAEMLRLGRWEETLLRKAYLQARKSGLIPAYTTKELIQERGGTREAETIATWEGGIDVTL